MSEATISSLDQKTLDNFNLVLRELTVLIAKENEFLSTSNDAPPKPLVEQKEELSSHYSALTARIRKRLPALHAAGKLDPADMENRVRSLVALVKENQSLLNARKIATAMRVEAVMKALAERESKDSHTYDPNGGYGSSSQNKRRSDDSRLAHLRA